MNDSGKYTILIADDEILIIRSIMNILIRNNNYIILSTENGKKACEIALKNSPDLIIMDWQMPVMNGLEATKQLKQNDLTKNIPIIIATGAMIESSYLSTAFLAGAVDFIRKPIDENELISRVANMLQLSQAYLKIEHQNIVLQSQLTSKLINIQQLNELKSEVISQLNIIKKQAIATENNQLNEAILKTERLLYSKLFQLKWEDFELHFQKIYPGFYTNIKSNQGSYTANELRLCSFLKLNMSNKEISLITYTSPDSVNTARKRLKKKLGLLPDESLQSFIQCL